MHVVGLLSMKIAERGCCPERYCGRYRGHSKSTIRRKRDTGKMKEKFE